MTTPHAPYWNPVLTADFCKACGDDWPCLPWRQSRPAKCLCSHVQHSGQCYSRACGCQTYRPDDVQGAKDRHPAGRDLPQTADIQDYLRQKGEL